MSLDESQITTPAEQTDENLWLEEIYGSEPLNWVRERNARTEEKLINAEYTALEGRVLEVLDSKNRIPGVAKRGAHYYNFWTDDQNPRGLWRRTSWASYQTDTPEWEIVLDLDALGAAESAQWVWHGAQFLRPEPGETHRRCLVLLSPDGGDAHVHREFDVVEKVFVDPAENGFVIPVAKSRVAWRDADTLFVGTDFGQGSLTASSYPRTSRILRRGQPLADAEPHFEIAAEHMVAVVSHDSTPGFERDVAIDVIDFFASQSYLRHEGKWLALDIPTDAAVDLHREWLLVRPQADTEIGGSALSSGSLHAIELEAFLAGSREFSTVFEPDAATSLQSWTWTKNHLILELLHDVSTKIVVTDPARNFIGRELDACPPLHLATVSAVDAEDHGAGSEGDSPEGDIGDDFWLTVTGFLTPSTLLRGSAAPDAGPATELKASPSFFNATDYTVEQHFAVSLDGSRIPYFQVGPKDLQLDRENSVYLSGYGGFEVSRTPVYSGIIGRGWLERGGVYVLANIRGGGEYGPAWHLAALKENRHKAYEDFAAVARDLVTRGGYPPGKTWLRRTQQRRPPGWEYAHPVSGVVRRDLLRRAVAGHEAVHQTQRRVLLDCRIRRSGVAGAVGVREDLFALPPAPRGGRLPGDVYLDRNLGRPGGPSAGAEDGCPNGKNGDFPALVLRIAGGWALRCC